MNDTANASSQTKPKRKTINSIASDAIREGLTNEQVLERVLTEFPYARTTKATIGKYRRMLIDEGEDVPTAAQARAEAGRRTAPPPRRPKRETPGSLALDALREGKTTQQVIDTVKAEFPQARMTRTMVSSYRDRLRGRGEAVPTAREATAAAAADFNLLVADLEDARAARAAMVTKAEMAAMESRLAWRIAGGAVAAGIAAAAAVKLLS